MRKAGNRVRVTAQLIDSRTGGHVWANRFDRDLTDIFAVQDELTQEIVGALKLKLSAGEQDRLTLRRSVNVEAYELYLRGREQAWAATRTGNVAARGLLERAIAIVRATRPPMRSSPIRMCSTTSMPGLVIRRNRYRSGRRQLRERSGWPATSPSLTSP